VSSGKTVTEVSQGRSASTFWDYFTLKMEALNITEKSVTTRTDLPVEMIYFSFTNTAVRSSNLSNLRLHYEEQPFNNDYR
jgi:hypothetical protein